MAVVNEITEKVEIPMYWDLILYVAVSKFLAQATQSQLDLAFSTAGGVGKVNAWINESSKLYDLDVGRSKRLAIGALTSKELESYLKMHSLDKRS